MDDNLGYTKGDRCNRDGCEGIIDKRKGDYGCSCHINPPCSYCTDPNEYCPVCDWDRESEDAE